jgi:gliding motility-associated-like protein
MKSATTLLIMCVLSTAGAQITLDRSVLSPFAVRGTIGEVLYGSTGGQVECTTWNNGDFYLTEGFEQPLEKGQLSVWYSVSYDPCNALYFVYIDSLRGCTEADSVTISWNDAPGERSFTTSEAALRLLVSGAAGCSYLQYIDLNALLGELPNCELEVFNVLTPNEDGKNDFFEIANIDRPTYTDNRVTIVNRWGQTVWEAEGYNNTTVRWTGDDQNGRVLADGTYYYFIEAGSIRLNGFLELTR